MLVAVLFDRRALTLRAVAIAAMIVLTLRPEALFGPAFRCHLRPPRHWSRSSG
jgi:competence protein ComEC